MGEPKHVPGVTEVVRLDAMDRYLVVLACVQNATGIQKQLEKASEEKPTEKPPQLIARPVSYSDSDRIARLKKMVRHGAAMDHHEEVDEEAREAERHYARAMEAYAAAKGSGAQSPEKPPRPKVTPSRRCGETMPFVLSRGIYRWVVEQLKIARFDPSALDYVPHLYEAFGIRAEDADLDLPAACFADDPPPANSEPAR